MRVGIIGSGYVGLVTGACLADLGNEVLCIDNNADKIRQLEAGHIPIFEPGLSEVVLTNCNEGRLSFSTEIEAAVEFADILFICVGTPPLPNGAADLSFMEQVIQKIARAMTSYKLIVEKSTVPVRTAEWLDELARKHFLDKHIEFDLASNPEFLSEGSALHDFMHPDRIVLGVRTERAATLLIQLYSALNAPFLVTDINSAELIKHASNAFLATKISFANALANICEQTGADINKVTKGIGLDKRIGEQFLRAGIGYGGSCFPKDVSAFIQIVEQHGYDFSLLKAVQEINLHQRQLFFNKIVHQLGGDVAGKTLAILGLAFKPNTDDMREAPSLTLVEQLHAVGAHLRLYDPVAMANARQLFADIPAHYADDPYQCCEGADAAIFVTEWSEFRYLNLLTLKNRLHQPIVIDGRNIFDPGKMRQMGFVYTGIGRS